MDKLIEEGSGTTITNDGATVMKKLNIVPQKATCEKCTSQGLVITDTHCDIIESYSLAFCSKTTRFEACIILQFVIIMSDMSLLIL